MHDSRPWDTPARYVRRHGLSLEAGTDCTEINDSQLWDTPARCVRSQGLSLEAGTEPEKLAEIRQTTTYCDLSVFVSGCPNWRLSIHWQW